LRPDEVPEQGRGSCPDELSGAAPQSSNTDGRGAQAARAAAAGETEGPRGVTDGELRGQGGPNGASSINFLFG
jgi:hypothetical protein